MASGGRNFFPEEILDILDQSDDFDDEPMMDRSDDEFEDISSLLWFLYIDVTKSLTSNRGLLESRSMF